MSVQPKTTGSGLTLSSVRTQTDMLEAWLETLPTPSMIEARYRVKPLLSAAEREVWTLFRIEEDSNGKRVYRATDSSDSPAAASHPDADLTTIGRVAVTLRRATSVTLLVPEAETNPAPATLPRPWNEVVHNWAVNYSPDTKDGALRALVGRIERNLFPEPDVSTATRRKELRALVHDWAVNGTALYFPAEDQVTLVEHLLGAKS